MRTVEIENKLVKFAKSIYASGYGLNRINSAIREIENFPNATSDERIILKYIKRYLKVIVLLKPSKQEKLVKRISSKYPTLFHDGSKQTPLTTHIINTLNYKSFRTRFAPDLFDFLGIKACPYCNGQLTISVEASNKRRKARFQLDHYFSKNKHPYLSISFFNLIPSCGNCNQGKSSSKVSLLTNFHLYTDKVINPFKFQFEKGSKASYCLSKDRSDIKIAFSGKDQTYADNHNKSFDIKGIYNSQIDLVEELFLKKEIYTANYKDDLRKIIAQSGIKNIDLDRIILSNYPLQADIHKRPMAKFTQDIAKDLGLI